MSRNIPAAVPAPKPQPTRRIPGPLVLVALALGVIGLVTVTLDFIQGSSIRNVMAIW